MKRAKNRITLLLAGLAILTLFQNCSGVEFANVQQATSDTALPSQPSNPSNPTAVTYKWVESGWGGCSAACGGGRQSQSVICRSNNLENVADSFCTSPKPATSQNCNLQACQSYNWFASGFGACSATCGGGVQTQTVSCRNISGQTVSNSLCSGAAPSTSQACNTQSCAPVCTPSVLQNLYNTAKATYNLKQVQLADACIDGPNPTEAINLTLPGPPLAVTRFLVTCATRWCAAHYGDNNAIGYSLTGLVLSSPTTLDPNGPITVKCYTNQIDPSAGAQCQSVVNSKPPLATFITNYSDPLCSSTCGCDVNSVSDKFSSPGQLTLCGTKYCQAKGYNWGMLQEVNSQQYYIRCSMTSP